MNTIPDFNESLAKQIFRQSDAEKLKYALTLEEKRLKNRIIIACIVGLSLIVSSYIMALSSRYEVSFPLRYDKWKCTYEQFKDI